MDVLGCGESGGTCQGVGQLVCWRVCRGLEGKKGHVSEALEWCVCLCLDVLGLKTREQQVIQIVIEKEGSS